MKRSRFSVAPLAVVLGLSACGREEPPPPVYQRPTSSVPTVPVSTAPTGLASSAALTAISIPPDGKYEKVQVEGVTVPMIQIMNGGTVVLIDTDGAKPRTWEEQLKRKDDLPKGYFDLHKTNTRKGSSFEAEPVDRTGRWKMDEKGNITKD